MKINEIKIERVEDGGAIVTYWVKGDTKIKVFTETKKVLKFIEERLNAKE